VRVQLQDILLIHESLIIQATSKNSSYLQKRDPIESAHSNQQQQLPKA
jgi:hypothetical protein